MTGPEEGGFGIGNAYEAAYVTIKTGIAPVLVAVGMRMLEFQYSDSPEVHQASREFNEGGLVEARRFARLSRANFESIRAFNWPARTGAAAAR